MGPVTTGGESSALGGNSTTDDGWMEWFLARTAREADFVRRACGDRVRTLLARGTGAAAAAMFKTAFVWDDEAWDWVETPWAARHIDAMVGSLYTSG